jgi:hypothetical protein
MHGLAAATCCCELYVHEVHGCAHCLVQCAAGCKPLSGQLCMMVVVVNLHIDSRPCHDKLRLTDINESLMAQALQMHSCLLPSSAASAPIDDPLYSDHM